MFDSTTGEPMHVSRVTGLMVSLLLTIAVLSAPAAQAVADKDCSDFGTQSAAQKFFLDQGGPQKDPHRLDFDGDGIACESNPCPCSTSTVGGGGADATATKRTKAKIIRVVDGDTVQVKILPRGPKPSVRLIGIDTPEVYGGVECGGKAASRSAKKLLPKGTRVRLVSDPSQDLKDRYGRLLRYVMKKGRDVNRVQIRRGHATVYVYNNNPFDRVKSYRAAQKYAKNHNLGIWKHCK